MKRILAILLIIIIVYFACSCSVPSKRAGASGQLIKPEDTRQELSIIFELSDAGFTKWEPFEKYKTSFEKQYGVKVNYIFLGGVMTNAEDIENFYNELAAKLHQTDGPELIFFNGGPDFSALIKQKAVIDVKGKINNLDSIYSSLASSELYCVPIAITYRPIVLNRKVLEALDIKVPEQDMDKESYYRIKDELLDKREVAFGYYEYNDMINRYMRSLDIFNMKEKRAYINTPQMKDCIKKIREEIFSGKYKLKSNYKYENYYNMLYEYLSDEYQEDSDLRNSEAYSSQQLRNRTYEYTITPLKPREISYIISSGEAVFMPHFSDEVSSLVYQGFLVNKNGKNIELACEFINGLLEKEVQMEIYKENGDSYPVNRELEGTIRDIEVQAKLDGRAIELKNYVLSEIKNGSCKLWTDSIIVEDSELFWKLVKDLAKYIFADSEYSDEELSKELQVLEDKYNIWLNE